MNCPSVPDNNEWPSQSLTQLLHKRNDFISANVVIVNLKRQTNPRPFGRHGDGTDHAEPVVSIPGSLYRCFTARCPGATVHRLKSEARFIDEYNAGIASTGFFFSRGQSFLRHRATAAASCSRATCCGFCGLKPRSCKIRPRWSG